MPKRLELHRILCEILGCPEKGSECRCHFQPPESKAMKYPAIVYSLDDIQNTYANGKVYLSKKRYAVTLIDKNPDSELVDRLASLPACRFNRHYKADNMNHYVFEIYF